MGCAYLPKKSSIGPVPVTVLKISKEKTYRKIETDKWVHGSLGALFGYFFKGWGIFKYSLGPVGNFCLFHYFLYGI